MASCDVGGDGNAPQDLYDILKNEEVVETELEEPKLLEALYLEKEEYLNEEEYLDEKEYLDDEEYHDEEEYLNKEEYLNEEYFDEEEYHDEEEYLVEAEYLEAEGTVNAEAGSQAKAGAASGAEIAHKAEPYLEYNEPVPATVTIVGMWDDKLDPMTLPRAPYTSAAVDSGSPPVHTPFDVLVTAPLDDDTVMEEDHVFHFADEHQLFQQAEVLVQDVAAEKPQQQRLPWRGGVAWRGGAAQRGRGRGLGARVQVPSGGPQWVRGERLVEVNINDDDVSEDLREIMREVRMREAARVRVTNRARRVREENEEEWIDADYGESFYAAEGISNIFEWSPMGDYHGEREQFLPQQTGVVVTSENAYGAFRQYWDDGIMSHIVTETNRYAAGLAGSSASFARDWYDTNIHELFVLFSFWMMLGIVRMPTVKSCFAINRLLQTNIYRELFSPSRYGNLCRAFHLNDNSTKPTFLTNPLYSLGPISDHLNARFKETYIPSQNICIDESLSLWKGSRSFRQYIRTKAARFEVKTFELCESSTGYLWSFFVYLRAGTSHDSGLPSSVLKNTSTVVQLIRPLLDKGYTLFMGKWFNSPLLARFLKTRKTDCVGTLNANRSNVPPLISLCNMKDGQFVARHSGDVVALAFQDKSRKIATISTYHGNSQGQMETKPYHPALYKPQIILDYNKSMEGVKRKDEMLEPYLPERKKRVSEWSIKFFKRLLNCSILNARILLQRSSATPTEHSVFRLELVDQILRHHYHLVPKGRPTHPVSSSLGHPQPQL